jgi:hypothetical protein
MPDHEPTIASVTTVETAAWPVWQDGVWWVRVLIGPPRTSILLHRDEALLFVQQIKDALR